MQVPNVYMAAANHRMLVQVITQQVVAVAGRAAMALGLYKRVFPAVVLDLPCTLFSMRTNEVPAATIVAANLKFAPKVQQLAALVLERIWLEASGPSKGLSRHGLFNGMDLKLSGLATTGQQTRLPGTGRPLLIQYLQVDTTFACPGPQVT